MVVLLPNEIDGLAKLEKELQTFDLKSLTSNMTMKKLDVFLPKFSTSFSVTLNKALSNVRMILNWLFKMKNNLNYLFGIDGYDKYV